MKYTFMKSTIKWWVSRFLFDSWKVRRFANKTFPFVIFVQFAREWKFYSLCQYIFCEISRWLGRVQESFQFFCITLQRLVWRRERIWSIRKIGHISNINIELKAVSRLKLQIHYDIRKKFNKSERTSICAYKNQSMNLLDTKHILERVNSSRYREEVSSPTRLQNSTLPY